MAYYLIKGCDKIYHGSYGMSQFQIVECKNDKDAIDWAFDLAQEVVESYSEIYDSLEEDVLKECEMDGIDYESDGIEVNNIREEIYSADYEIEIAILNESWLPTLDTNELEELYWEDEDNFEKLYVLRWI